MRKFLSSALMGALVGGSLLGLPLLAPTPAEALSEDEIVGMLEQVPVFLILNSDGQPLTASAEQASEEIKVPVVFIDGETAEDFLEDAQTEDSSAQVVVVDLGTLFQETILNAESTTPLLYFPTSEEVSTATELEANFQGVPLFMARQGLDGPYLTITQDGESSLPVFFSHDDLQTLLDAYEANNAEAADDITVQVLSLEWLIAVMAENDDPTLDDQLEKIRLFPSTDVLNYIRAQQGAAPTAE
jgi:hypothetical protein